MKFLICVTVLVVKMLDMLHRSLPITSQLLRSAKMSTAQRGSIRGVARGFMFDELSYVEPFHFY